MRVNILKVWIRIWQRIFIIKEYLQIFDQVYDIILMSKINSDFLKTTISDLLNTRKPRQFVQTIELQIGFRDYDPKVDKRFNASIRLPNKVYGNLKVCIMANFAHIEEAKASGIPFIDIDNLKTFNRDKGNIKSWAKNYDVLLVSASIARQLNYILGSNTLLRLNLFPITLAEGEKIATKIEQLKHTIKFQTKRAPCLGTAIGNVESGEDALRQNIIRSVNFLVSLLKKGWQNIGSLHIKTTMGKSYHIFG